MFIKFNPATKTLMNIIHFSPSFPPNYFNFTLALRNAGATVLGIGDTPWEQLRPELQQAMHEYYRVDDLHSFDQLKAAVDFFKSRYGTIDALESHNEHWLETEAQLREYFGIEGYKPSQLLSAKRKSEMKKIFKDAGVKVAPGAMAESLEQSRSFITEAGFPVVAKPDSGVGSSGTFLIRNDDDLAAFFQHKPSADYFLEAFIDGDIFSYDGLAGKNGDVVFATAMKNQMGVMNIVNDDLHTFYYTMREMPPDLEEAGLKVLKAFKVQGRFFHLEFFREHKSGQLIALEVNMRPPGGFSTDMFNFSADIDVYKAWAEMMVNNQNHLACERKYYVCFVSRKNRYKYRLTHDEVLERFGDHIIFHSDIADIFSRAMGNYCYLLRSASLDKIFEIQEQIHLCD
jgi:hypothetical protein